MKNKFYTYLLYITPGLMVADDGHLRALGIARLASFFLPIIGVLFLMFVMIAVDRFNVPRPGISKALKIVSWLLLSVIILFQLLLGYPHDALYLGLVLILVILLVLYLDYRLKIQLEHDLE